VRIGRYKKPEDFGEGDWRSALPRMQKENWEKNYKYVSFSYLICITERLTRTMNRVVHNRIVEVCLALSLLNLSYSYTLPKLDLIRS